MVPLPTAHGEKLVMRIFDPEVLVRDWKALGFSQEECIVRRFLTAPRRFAAARLHGLDRGP